MEDSYKSYSLTFSPLWISWTIENKNKTSKETKPNQTTAFLVEPGKEGESLGLSLMSTGF